MNFVTQPHGDLCCLQASADRRVLSVAAVESDKKLANEASAVINSGPRNQCLA